MPLQIELIEQSFKDIQPHANDFMNSFYKNLFAAYPEAKPLFESTNMKTQKQKLLGALVLVVNNLREPKVIDKAFRGLGARHVKYGALPKHYPLIGNTLLKTFEEYLGDSWTPEMRQAWVDAYGGISQMMLDGADYSEAEIALSSTTTESLKKEAKPLNLPIELLERSFEAIKPNANFFVNSFYKNLFTAYPQIKPLFETRDIEVHKKKLLDYLMLVVENLRMPDVLEQSLKDLGQHYVKYGALPEHYPLVGNALLITLKQYLGACWTPEIRQAWIDACGVISQIMLDGADYSEAEIVLPDSPPETEEAAETPALQIELLERSFEAIKPNANSFANSFYKNLLTAYPQIKPLFETRDIEVQKKKLLNSLVLVVENLRMPDVLEQTLKDLGQHYVKYGALPEHYPLVGNALLITLKQYLGACWTPEIRQAWIDACGVISQTMLDGADYSQDDIALKSPLNSSDTGDSSYSMEFETSKP